MTNAMSKEGPLINVYNDEGKLTLRSWEHSEKGILRLSHCTHWAYCYVHAHTPKSCKSCKPTWLCLELPSSSEVSSWTGQSHWEAAWLRQPPWQVCGCAYNYPELGYPLQLVLPLNVICCKPVGNLACTKLSNWLAAGGTGLLSCDGDLQSWHTIYQVCSSGSAMIATWLVPASNMPCTVLHSLATLMLHCNLWCLSQHCHFLLLWLALLLLRVSLKHNCYLLHAIYACMAQQL